MGVELKLDMFLKTQEADNHDILSKELGAFQEKQYKELRTMVEALGTECLKNENVKEKEKLLRDAVKTLKNLDKTYSKAQEGQVKKLESAGAKFSEDNLKSLTEFQKQQMEK